MTNPPDPESPPPRTTGGNWRWEPPTPAALDAMLPGYTVEKLLGQGGMGAVYKGVQISLDRPVAIKILPGGIEKEDPSYSERFRNEARVMARLLHPAIVAVFDFGQTPDGQLYFVMEYVDGTDIHQMIASQGKLSAEHALAITAHVCDALTAAHGLGIVHRDIKPANVLINLQGQVKVADFGLAKVDEPGQHGITKTGYALGTPDFVAPEALVLGVNVDARADLYAVGVMLYEMLTGELPRGAWKAPSEKVPGLDHRFDAIVVKAMQGDPGDRHQSAVELRRDLDVILTVPLVKADAPPTSALPQQAVADLPAQRSAAAVKVTPRGKRAAKVPGQVAAPVKLPSKAAGSGSKVRFLPIGIGAAILLVASVFYGLKGRETASKPSPKGAPADPQTVVAASDSPPSGPPTPKATQKIPEPKPNPTAPATTPAKAPNSAPPAFGAYPAGLKVPVPDWLRKASEEGGRLEFIKTDGLPKEFDPLFDLGEAAKFDDFVAVYRGPYRWMAIRKGGDVWGKTWLADYRSIQSFGPIPAVSIVRTFNPIIVGQDSKVYYLATGDKPHPRAESPNVMGAIGQSNSSGFLHVLLGASNETLETRNTLDGLIPPPPDFFRGASAIGAASGSYFAATPGQPLRSWDHKTGAPVPIKDPPSDVVEIAGGGTDLLVLSSAGDIRVIHATTGTLYPSGGRPPSDLGPAIRVRRAGVCFLAQRTTGTWMAWQTSTDEKVSDRSELMRLIGDFGPALDMESHFISFPGKETAGFWALAIRPKTTADAAPAKPANQLTAAPPASLSGPTVPDWLIEARKRGGKVHFFGTAPKEATERGRIEEFDDVVDVQMDLMGIAVRRTNGETHSIVWTSKEPTGGLVPPVLKTPAIGHGDIVGLYSDTSPGFHLLWAGQFVGVKGVTQPQAVGTVHTQYHVTTLGTGGKILGSVAWGGPSDEKPQDTPPPADFFLGATALTGTQWHYISARPGQPVRSWDVQKQTLSEFPTEIHDVVDMHGTRHNVILLTAAGQVFVTTPDGKPVTSSNQPEGIVPQDLGPAIGIAAGIYMSAAQMTDGTWRAWGRSPKLIEQTQKIGPALAVDYAFDTDKPDSMIWIEPPAAAPAPAPVTTSAPPQPVPSGPITPAPTSLAVSPTPALDLVAIPGFKSRLEGYLGARRSQVGDLAAKYLRGLDARLNQAADTGDLALVKAFRDEKASVEALLKTLATPPTDLLAAVAESATLTELPEDSPDGLTGLRTTWQTERQKIRDALDGKLRQSLQALEAELTKAREFEKAEAVQLYREAFGKVAAVPATPSTVAAEKPDPASTPAANSAVASSALKLPPWLEKAAKEGGKLRIWGTFDGKPIDEKEALKEFRERDFTQVATGVNGLILGIQRRGNGKCITLDPSNPYRKLRAFNKLQFLDRRNSMWLADNHLCTAGGWDDEDLKLGGAPFITGSLTGHLIRLPSSEWIAPGYHWNNPEDESIRPTLKKICDELRTDEATIAASSSTNRVLWITKENRLRDFSVKLHPGAATENPVTSKPTEQIVELISAGGSYGNWVTLGASGSVYVDRLGGFESLVAELSPAVTLRVTTGGGVGTVAAKKPDGTWHSMGPNEELNAFIASVGPAIDLDVFALDAGEKTKIVLWIEPNTVLKPK